MLAFIYNVNNILLIESKYYMQIQQLSNDGSSRNHENIESRLISYAFSNEIQMLKDILNE